MNLLGHLLTLHTPLLVKEQILTELTAGTAVAFGSPVPSLDGSTYLERLEQYARYTRDQAERAVREGRDLVALQTRLREQAFALGERLRTRLGIDGQSEAMTIVPTLYRAIGIDLQSTPCGEITIDRCFFSAFYTPEVCHLISALDEGVIAGLAGSGHLHFSQRLTEGFPCCKARFTHQEERS